MTQRQIASRETHLAIARVPERPVILARVASQLRKEIGHGAAWKSGAAYLTLTDFSTLAVPKVRLKAALKMCGNYVIAVR